LKVLLLQVAVVVLQARMELKAILVHLAVVEQVV
jgi:hypothetical protein